VLQRISFLIFLVIALSACSQQELDLKKHEGIIAEIEEKQNERNQILVISNIDEDDIINKNNEELIEVARENDGAYYSFKSADYEDLEVGMRVIIHWNGDQEDSDPPQRGAESIDIDSE